MKPFVSGEGLCSDPSHVLIFGLGDRRATTATVTFIDGTQRERSGDFRNATIEL